MKHPDEAVLALFAGHDLGFVSEWRTRRHVARCRQCSAAVDALIARVEREFTAGACDPAWATTISEYLKYFGPGGQRVGFWYGDCNFLPASREVAC